MSQETVALLLAGAVLASGLLLGYALRCSGVPALPPDGGRADG